jgi:hypothetical protein
MHMYWVPAAFTANQPPYWRLIEFLFPSRVIIFSGSKFTSEELAKKSLKLEFRELLHDESFRAGSN